MEPTAWPLSGRKPRLYHHTPLALYEGTFVLEGWAFARGFAPWILFRLSPEYSRSFAFVELHLLVIKRCRSSHGILGWMARRVFGKLQLHTPAIGLQSCPYGIMFLECLWTGIVPELNMFITQPKKNTLQFWAFLMDFHIAMRRAGGKHAQSFGAASDVENLCDVTYQASWSSAAASPRQIYHVWICAGCLIPVTPLQRMFPAAFSHNAFGLYRYPLEAHSLTHDAHGPWTPQ